MLSVLRAPGVLPLFLASCVARLPMGALGLLFVLHTHDLTGSYAKGGLAAGLFALGAGVAGPILARVIDRRGQTAVLRVGGVLSAVALLWVALLPASAPFGVLLALAALAGASEPPIGACMRGLWTKLFEEPERRHAAYSLEGALLEIVYISGPVAIVAGIGSWSIRAALGVSAACVLVGNVVFSMNPRSRSWLPDPGREDGLLGALRGPGVRVLLGVFLLAGLGIGAVEVAVPAALDEIGERDLTGLLFGIWGVGSMLAGFAVGRFGPGTNPRRRLGLLLVVWGFAHAAVGLGGSPFAIGLLLLVAGATIAPTFVCANGMLDQLALPGTLTESFTWLSTGMTAGIAAGSAVGGALTEAASPGAATVVLGSGGLVAAALVAASAAVAVRARAVPV